MENANEPNSATDPFDLNRFVQAHQNSYETALAEMKSGRKRSHWMWYIFPQLAGLGFSPTSQRYSIKSKAEVLAYLEHPLLGPRIVECFQAVLANEGHTACDIFGSPDDLKLRSCATLFASCSKNGSVFHQVLDKFFDGQPDAKTLRLVGSASIVE